MLLLPFLTFLCFPATAQFIDSSLYRPNSVYKTELGWYKLESMNLAVAGKKRRAKKGRRSPDKDTGMFALTSLTITSFPNNFPATHVERNGIFKTPPSLVAVMS